MADEHKPETGVSASPAGPLPVADDGHGHGPPGPSDEAVAQGHEDDKFGVRAILYVPLLVVITLTGAYLMVTVLVGIGYDKEFRTTGNNERLTERNAKDINKRFERISSTDVDAPVKQPRLEKLEVMQNEVGEPERISPPYVRSKLPTAENNSPIYRPESLWPQNYVDPQTGRKVLAEYHELGGEEAGKAQIPIMTAIDLVVNQNLLPVSDKPVRVTLTTADTAKLSNGGLGVVPAAADFGTKGHDQDDKPVEKKKD